MNDQSPVSLSDDSHSVGKRVKRHRNQFRSAVAIGILVWVALVGFYKIKIGGGISTSQEQWGQFGDYVGGLLNPIFSFGAFLLLVLTWQDQRLEIEAERKRRARQDFEATFFQLIHRFSEIVDAMQFTRQQLVVNGRNLAGYQDILTEGRNAMRDMFLYFKERCEERAQEDGIVPKERYAAINSDFYHEWQHELGIYFRTLYHIFKFVDKSPLSYEEQTRYANIARAQLSAYELAMIFYNGLWGEGQSGFKPLIEKFGILKHLKAQTVVRASDLEDRGMYAETARANYKRRIEIWKGNIPSVSYD